MVRQLCWSEYPNVLELPWWCELLIWRQRFQYVLVKGFGLPKEEIRVLRIDRKGSRGVHEFEFEVIVVYHFLFKL